MPDGSTCSVRPSNVEREVGDLERQIVSLECQVADSGGPGRPTPKVRSPDLERQVAQPRASDRPTSSGRSPNLERPIADLEHEITQSATSGHQRRAPSHPMSNVTSQNLIARFARSRTSDRVRRTGGCRLRRSDGGHHCSAREMTPANRRLLTDDLQRDSSGVH